MYFEELKNFKFYLSLGYVVIIASFITIVIMEIIKYVLRKKNIINNDMNANKKDNILTNIGRFISLIVYVIVYLINELVLKNNIEFNETLFVGLLSGGAMTLTVAKGIYTAYRQTQKRNDVYNQLESTKKELAFLQKETASSNGKILLTKKEKSEK